MLVIGLLSYSSLYSQTIFEIVEQSEVHDTLEIALEAAMLDGTLSEANANLTLFAPTDAAFAALPAGTIETLLGDPMGALTSILTYHVLGSEVVSTSLANGVAAETLQGQDVIVAIRNDSIFINNALVTMEDVQASNGVVHIIDAVLLPPENIVDVVVNSELHNTLELAVGEAQLAETLSGDGPFTLFAPTDEAFAAVPSETLNALLGDPLGALTSVLTYHALADSVAAGDLSSGIAVETVNGLKVVVAIRNDSVFINNSVVTITDIQAPNGIVHVIDAVLLPQESIVDVVVNSQLHNTLEFAVGEAQLATTLSDDGPFTLFAPTDAAFAALDSNLLNSLLADPTDALASVLTYHAIQDSIVAGDLSSGIAVETVNGKKVIVAIRNDSVFINNSQVILTDIQAPNGVVHVLDAVLVPPTTVADVVVNSELHNTLEFAVGEAQLVETLSGDGTFTLFAPTDAAFAAVPAATLNSILGDPSGALTQVLTYHVLDSEVLAAGLSDGLTATTLQGEMLTFTDNAGMFEVDGNGIIITDIEVDNGVVHVIDGVLLPNVVSVERLDQSGLDIQVFPNPVSDRLIIDIQDPSIREANIDLTNSLGQRVASWKLANGRTDLSLTNLVGGMYYLQLTIDGKQYYQPLVIRN